MQSRARLCLIIINVRSDVLDLKLSNCSAGSEKLNESCPKIKAILPPLPLPGLLPFSLIYINN